MPTMLIQIPQAFRPHAAAAVVRFGYLHPHLSCAVTAEGDVEVAMPAGAEDAAVRRDLLHLLYREKIYAETLGLRRALYEACMR